MAWRRTLLLGFIGIVWGASLATALVISTRTSTSELYQRQFDNEVATRAADGIHLAAEYGIQLVAAAKTNLTGCIEVQDIMMERMAANIDCDATSVLRQTSDECTNCCPTMRALILAISVGVLELPPSSLTVYIGNKNLPIVSKTVSYKYESTDKRDEQLNCPLTKIIKVKKLVVAGVKISKSESTQGYSIEESCVSLRILESKNLLELVDNVNSSQERYDNALEENADAVFGSTISVENLMDEGALECDRTISSCGNSKADVYLKCNANAISKEDGSFSSESCTGERTVEVEIGDAVAMESGLEILFQQVSDQLVGKITQTMSEPDR
ncbi:hypothetical protein NDN08_004894 [Rhodosorus marinus]|uniref:Uncharacterized protein n=1 Tax=Rhodosorus marinus TaxID=101924 RepID=A0AAV8UID6_9RHOD|nr:hypothetical protein NDN08_004894 [Rhodosorus marinus]